MRLVQFKVTNFRRFAGTHEIDVGDLTALVGRNDAGKSTLLAALDYFFSDKKLEPSDACIHESGAVEIACVFEDAPAEVVIDAERTTSLKREHLLRSDGRLEVAKRWAKRAGSAATFIVAEHPSHPDVADLLELTNTDLKKRCKESGVGENVNLSVNAEMRSALRSKCDDLQLKTRELSVDKANDKALFDGITKLLPTFHLFRADRESLDQDNEAQGPMKFAVKRAIQAQESTLKHVAMAVEEELRRVANETLGKLREVNPELASKLTPDFKTKWEGAFSISLKGDDDIPINKRGSGVRRLILLSFFRAEVERELRDDASVIYAIEEPETSQHPHHQALLLEAFQSIASTAGRQVILTTHTPSIASQLPLSGLRLVRHTEAGRSEVVPANQGAAQIVDELGILPDKRLRLFVMLEGPHDVQFLRRISRILNQTDPTIPSLENLEDEGRIAFVPLGGGNLKAWVHQHYLQSMGIPEFHLYDCDDPKNPKYQQQTTDVNQRGDGSSARLTKKRELENYLHCSVPRLSRHGRSRQMGVLSAMSMDQAA